MPIEGDAGRDVARIRLRNDYIGDEIAWSGGRRLRRGESHLQDDGRGHGEEADVADGHPAPCPKAARHAPHYAPSGLRRIGRWRVVLPCSQASRAQKTCTLQPRVMAYSTSLGRVPNEQEGARIRSPRSAGRLGPWGIFVIASRHASAHPAPSRSRTSWKLRCSMPTMAIT